MLAGCDKDKISGDNPYELNTGSISFTANGKKIRSDLAVGIIEKERKFGISGELIYITNLRTDTEPTASLGVIELEIFGDLSSIKPGNAITCLTVEFCIELSYLDDNLNNDQSFESSIIVANLTDGAMMKGRRFRATFSGTGEQDVTGNRVIIEEGTLDIKLP